MLYINKSKYLKKSQALMSALIIASGITALNAQADDLLIVAERSKGVDVAGGDNSLSAAETLTVGTKGRLWAVKQDQDSSYNVICMNQSAEPITLFPSDSSPWLKTAQGNCTEKATNVYSCSNDQRPAVMCRTQAVVKKSDGSGITDMTAVALRSLDNSDEAFYRIANSVMEQHKLHFDLCQDMHGEHSSGGISFVIQATGEVEEVNIIENGELATPQRANDYAKCMAQAIGLWRFPTLDYIYEMEYAFVN